MTPLLDVLHLSVLNPVDHPRMCQRLAVTHATQWTVGLAGVALEDGATKLLYLPPGLSYFAHPRPKGAIDRLIRANRLVRLALRLRPRLVVLHSPELLPWVGQLSRHMAVWFDMHEDYPANLRYGSAYAHWPPAMREGLARALAGLQRRAAPQLAAASYAEVCFGNLLGLPDGRWATLQNRYQSAVPIAPPTLDLPPNTPLLLSCGTLADDWGLWSSLALWRSLNESRRVAWAVVGQGSAATLARLRQAVADSPCADLFYSDARPEGVPYARLLGWVQRCTAVLALYRPTAAIAQRIPTKVYEAMAFRRPVLLTAGGPGAALNAPLAFGLELEAPDTWAHSPERLRAATQQVIDALDLGFPSCYPRAIDRTEWDWAAHDAPALIALTESVLAAKRPNPAY